jgi:hypothetical protein
MKYRNVWRAWGISPRTFPPSRTWALATILRFAPSGQSAAGTMRSGKSATLESSLWVMTPEPSTVAFRPTPRMVHASSTGPHCSTTTAIISHAIIRECLFMPVLQARPDHTGLALSEPRQRRVEGPAPCP